MNKIDDEHKRASGANDLLQGAASNKTLGGNASLIAVFDGTRWNLV